MTPSPLNERLHSVVGGITYKALAEATKAHPESVRRYMQGQTPSAEFLAALCTEFDVNANWLLTGEGPVRNSEGCLHALRNAPPSDLLSSLARSIDRLMKRVERLELLLADHEVKSEGAATLRPVAAVDPATESAAARSGDGPDNPFARSSSAD